MTAAEKLLTWTVVPQLRVALLRGLGARIGRDVRIYEVRFINVADGFGHLVIGDHVHIGPGTMIDLTRRVRIGTHTVIAPHCILHTHTDAGEVLGSPMARRLPTVRAPVELGRACYLGARSTVLAGVTLGDLTAVAAGSVVTRSTEGHELVGGTPAHRLRRFDVTD
ncbi:MAG: acyltransferase [Acidimicrobiia bacterium]